MSLAPPPGVLLGTRRKLSKLRSVENLQWVCWLWGTEGNGAQTQRRVKSDSSDVSMCICGCLTVEQ